ncbi:MAG: hypothetical protein M3R63_20665 [Actinomycetota bacterium]|nr:hypothetical protein [Actinomycetota bacterium]
MADISHGEPVRVVGEQRLHPALRKLGRACVALARWRRAQQQTLTVPTTDETASATDTGSSGSGAPS